MTTAFIVIVVLAVLVAARDRRQGHNPNTHLRMLAMAIFFFAIVRCSQ